MLSPLHGDLLSLSTSNATKYNALWAGINYTIYSNPEALWLMLRTNNSDNDPTNPTQLTRANNISVFSSVIHKKRCFRKRKVIDLNVSIITMLNDNTHQKRQFIIGDSVDLSTKLLVICSFLHSSP